MSRSRRQAGARDRRRLGHRARDLPALRGRGRGGRGRRSRSASGPRRWLRRSAARRCRRTSPSPRTSRGWCEAAGRIDVLVNNAGGGFADDVLEISEEEWDADVTLNLKSAFLCSKAVLPGMIEQRLGVIVNIASVNGIAFFANEPYSAAKAGLISLTRSMAVRYGKHGIRAVAIAPGTIRSPLWQERVDKEPAIFERLVRWYPLRRVGEPEDVGERGRLPRLRRRVVDQRRRAAGRRRPARRQRADGARARRELLARRRESRCSTS